jgi:hypothetical protein
MLAGLQTSNEAPTAFDFHVGRVDFFAPDTGENVIIIRGGAVPNVPMLNIGDSINLQPGDNVVVLKWQTGYFILGRVVSPNTTGFASQGIELQAQTTHDASFALTTTNTERCEQIFLNPPWANFCLLHAHATLMGANNSGGNDSMHVAVSSLGTVISWSSIQEVPNGGLVTISSNYAVEFSVVPGFNFHISCWMHSDNNTWASSIFNQATLNASVIYQHLT